MTKNNVCFSLGPGVSVSGLTDFWIDGNVPYFDYGGNYTCVYFCQNSWICTLKMDICNLYLNMLDFKKILLLSMEDRKDMTLTLLYLLLT